MELLEVILGVKTLKETSLYNDKQQIVILNANTGRYLDANKANLDMLNHPVCDYQMMTGFDTCIQIDAHLIRLEKYFRHCRNWGCADDFIKTSVNRAGGLISYNIKTRVINDLLICTVNPVPKPLVLYL